MDWSKYESISLFYTGGLNSIPSWDRIGIPNEAWRFIETIGHDHIGQREEHNKFEDSKMTCKLHCQVY